MVSNENYLVIQGWMINELNLKGNELLVYAVVYGFAQDNESKFTGSAQYIADWCGVSKKTVYSVLKSLCEKDLLVKHERDINGVKICDYSISLVGKNCARGREKTSHHNIEDNNIKEGNNIIINNNTITQESVELWNTIADKYHLAKILNLTPARKNKLQARMEQIGCKTEQEFFQKINYALKTSLFLRGKKMVNTSYGPEMQNGTWKADFDFFMQPSSLQKAVEGGYADPDLV